MLPRKFNETKGGNRGCPIIEFKIPKSKEDVPIRKACEGTDTPSYRVASSRLERRARVGAVLEPRFQMAIVDRHKGGIDCQFVEDGISR